MPQDLIDKLPLVHAVGQVITGTNVVVLSLQVVSPMNEG